MSIFLAAIRSNPFKRGVTIQTPTLGVELPSFKKFMNFLKILSLDGACNTTVAPNLLETILAATNQVLKTATPARISNSCHPRQIWALLQLARAQELVSFIIYEHPTNQTHRDLQNESRAVNPPTLRPTPHAPLESPETTVLNRSVDLKSSIKSKLGQAYIIHQPRTPIWPHYSGWENPSAGAQLPRSRCSRC
jgi:hypothetical protein